MNRFRALGALDLVRSEGPEIRTVLAQPKRVALLAYLAVARPTGFHRRDRLLAMFWPDAEDERARASTQSRHLFLRRELGDDVIVNAGDDEILPQSGSRLVATQPHSKAISTADRHARRWSCIGVTLLPGFSLPMPMVSRRGSRENALA
jgi:DNA-binding SARP family transcriptional activator